MTEFHDIRNNHAPTCFTCDERDRIYEALEMCLGEVGHVTLQDGALAVDVRSKYGHVVLTLWEKDGKVQAITANTLNGSKNAINLPQDAATGDIRYDLAMERFTSWLCEQ